MRGLKQMLREEAERKARKAERERIKKEKEEQRIREIKERKRAKRKKLLKAKQNKRAYAKRRKAQLEQHMKEGDEYGYYMILLMKDKRKIKRLAFGRWKNGLMQKFDEIVNKNREEVSFPKCFVKSIDGNHQIKTEYEIVVVELLKEGEDNTTRLRNKEGLFINHVIVDNNNYALIRKEDWWEEEYFSVYGYDPLKDKKTLKEVLPDIINFLGDSVIIAHNASFDIGFIQEAIGRKLSNPIIDTLPLCRYLFTEEKRFNLGSLCRSKGIDYDEENAHRADYDAEVLKDLYLSAILPKLTNDKIT